MVHKDELVTLLVQKGYVDWTSKGCKRRYTKQRAKNAIDDVFELILELMAGGEDVMIRGFGTFEVKDRAARTSISPGDGESYYVEPFKGAAFYPGQRLKDVVRNEKYDVPGEQGGDQ